ncbi:MAG: hypothetical protein K0R45_1325, partial [Pseudomonas sp.]|nr:hypothetical protein [Pseudomonas sp.]
LSAIQPLHQSIKDAHAYASSRVGQRIVTPESKKYFKDLAREIKIRQAIEAKQQRAANYADELRTKASAVRDKAFKKNYLGVDDS